MGLKVLKARKGDELRQQVEAEMATASEDVRKQVIALRDSYINDQKSAAAGANGGYSNREARILQNDFYNRALTILKSKGNNKGYSEINPNLPKTNIFGGYSSQDMTDIGNNITKNFYEQNSKPTEPVVEESDIQQNPTTAFYDFGYNTDYNTYMSGLTKDQQRSKFLEMIDNNINAALDAYDAGKTVRYPQLGRALTADDLRQVQTAIQNAKNANYSTYDSATNAANLVRDSLYRIGVPEDVFNQYFTFNQTEDEKNQAILSENGWSNVNYMTNPNFTPGQQEFLRSKSARVYRKGNDYQVYTEDWNPYENLWYVDSTDPSSTNYGYGVYSDGNGKMWFGDFQKARNDSSNPYQAEINSNLKRDWEKGNSLYYQGEEGVSYDPRFIVNQNPLMDQLFYEIANGDILNVSGLTNYLDASRMFEGNNPVLAMNIHNVPFVINDLTGLPEFNDDTIFYTLDENGKIYANQFNEFKNKYRFNATGFPMETNSDQLGTGHITEYSIPDYETFGSFIAPPTNIFTSDDIYVQAFLKMLYGNDTNGINHDQQDFLQKIINNSDTRLEKMQQLYKAVKEGSIKIPYEYLSYFKAMQQQLQQSVPQNQAVIAQKNGGVVKALQGTRVTYGSDQQKTDKSGVDQALENYERKQSNLKAIQKQGYSTEKQWREGEQAVGDDVLGSGLMIGAAVADMTSLIAAFMSGTGLGAGISLAAGLTSSALTFANDWHTDGLDWGDVKSLAVNLGMDLAAPLTFGKTKMAKMAKNVTKMIPFLFAAFDQYENAHEYKDIIQKLFITHEDVTKNELRVLLDGLKLLTGSVGTIARGAKMRTLQNAAEANYNPDKKIVPIQGVGKDGKPKRFEIKPKEAEEIAKAKDYNTANELFQIATGNEGANLVPDKNGRFGHGFKGFFNPKNSTENPLANKTLTEIAQPADLVGRYEAARQKRPKWRQAGKHFVATDLDRAMGNTGPMGLWVKDTSIRPQLMTSSEKDGGRLERLQNYIKNK